MMAIAIASLLPLCSAAQYDLKYLPCKICTGSYTPVSFKINGSTSDLTSDFGKRQCSLCSTWHRGVDLVVADATDAKGYHILSPFNGTIAAISKFNNYIVLSIDGPGGDNLGFGHIFQNGNVPIVVGDMVFNTLMINNLNYYVIIDKTMGKAWCVINGISFNYEGVNYITSNQVVTGNRLAPIGDSEATNVHVHLYRHVDPYSNLQTPSNCKNPLKILNHMNSDMNITQYDPYALSPAQAGISYYAGNQPACIKVSCNMNGYSLLPDNILSSYQHRMMAIDKLGFYIGKASAAMEPSTNWGQASSAFRMVSGPHYSGYICNGSLPASTIYPPNLTDNTLGSNTHTGIFPYAYSSMTKDDYFYADFYQRLHQNSTPGTATPLMAKCVKEAMYPDGDYRLLARAETIEGLYFSTPQTQSKVIRIDNFLPFIQKVKVIKSSMFTPFYMGEWLWNGNSLDYINQVDNQGTGGANLSVIVETSEPMQELSMAYDNFNSQVSTTGVPGTDNTQFIFAIPAAYLQTGTMALVFKGKDLSGNELMVLDAETSYAAAQIPVRTGNTTWSPMPNTGLDKVHKITIGEVLPPEAAFSPHEITINPGNYVYFQDASTGMIDAWSWYFDGGLPYASSLQNPAVLFDQEGDYTVTLNVLNALGMSSATGLVHVTNEPINPVCDFSPKNITVSEGSTVYFSDLSSGAPSQWWWDFDGVEPMSFEPNPMVTYNSSGIYNVNLTVSNASGLSGCATTIMVVPQIPPMSAICHVMPFMGSPGVVCSFSADVMFGTPPYQLVFNFGDGTVIPQTSSFSLVSVNHQYQTSGNFTLVVGITDANGLYETCYESVFVLPADPCESLQMALKVDGSESQTSIAFGNAHVFSAEPLGGQSPYYFAWTFYPEELTAAVPSALGSYQPGPHTLTFPSPGNYKVKVHVCDQNGCTRTILRNYTVFQPEHCMIAKIQKKHGGELVVPLGQNCFYDFSQVLGSVQCQDPPGTLNVPCITNSRWELKSYPAGALLASKNCVPFSDPECTMGYVSERLFSYNFSQKGLYTASMRIWDNNCAVQAGYDCEDKTEVLVRVLDCNDTVIANADLPIALSGQNPDVYAGTIISGDAGGYCLPANATMNWYANKEIVLKSWTSLLSGCEFQASIMPCPETFCDKNEPIASATMPGPVVEVYPNPGKGMFAVRVTAGTEALQRIEVFNCLGELMKTLEAEGKSVLSMDLTKVPAGMYIMKVWLDKSNQTLKITKY